jgi:hypothetical protein
MGESSNDLKELTVIVKLTEAEAREREKLRKLINQRVDDAMKRGWKATTIGVLLTNDTTLLAKLKRPEHNFQLSTLRVIMTRLDSLAGDAPVPARAQRFLAS